MVVTITALKLRGKRTRLAPALEQNISTLILVSLTRGFLPLPCRTTTKLTLTELPVTGNVPLIPHTGRAPALATLQLLGIHRFSAFCMPIGPTGPDGKAYNRYSYWDPKLKRPAAAYPHFTPMPCYVTAPYKLSPPLLNRWYCYEMMVKLNSYVSPTPTPGSREITYKNDGEVMFWIDDHLYAHWTDLYIAGTSNITLKSLNIDLISVNMHERESHAWVNEKYCDNIVVATDYIGPISAGKSRPTRSPKR
jgi:hypothetical protein